MTPPVINSIPGFGAKSEQWIVFHKDLKSNFGKKTANSIWVKAWGLKGNSDANNSSLRDYLDKNNIKISTSRWDDVTDFGGDALDFFGDIFTVAKWGGIALGVILLGGLAMTVYNIAKNPAQSAGTAARAFATKGL
jgi:hypothetical protein